MFRRIMPLLLTVFIDSLGFGLVFPLLPTLIMQTESPMLPDVSVSVKGMVYGLIISMFCIGQFFGGPFLGSLSDRFGRKKVLCCTLLIACTSYLAGALSVFLGSVVLFMLSRLTVGISAGNFAIAQSMVADISSEEQKRNNFGLVGMAWGVGFILGPYLGGSFAETGGMVAPFLFSALICLGNLLLVWFFMKETLVERRKTPWTLLGSTKEILKAFAHPTLRGIFFVTFLFSMGWGFFTEFSSIFLIDRYNFGPKDIGSFYAYAGIWVALCQGILIRPFMKRFSAEKLLRAGLFFLALNLLIFVSIKSFWIIALALPLIAFPESLIYPNIASMVSTLSRKDEQGEMLGILNSVQWASVGILPLFSGAIVANYTLMPILFSSALIFVSFGAFAYFFRQKKTAPVDQS